MMKTIGPKFGTHQKNVSMFERPIKIENILMKSPNICENYLILSYQRYPSSTASQATVHIGHRPHNKSIRWAEQKKCW